ncbi:unnamed protein product [Coccothraustes coccothraustes]
MTRQPLSFQAWFQLLGGETSAVVFRFGTAEGFMVRGDWRGDPAFPAEGGLSLSLCPYLRWHSITEVAVGKAGLAQDEQLLSCGEAAEPCSARDRASAWLPAVLWAVSTAATAQTP